MQYDKLTPGLVEIILEILKLSVISGAVCILFFDSVLGLPVVIPIVIYQMVSDKREYGEKMKRRLTGEFKDMIISIDSALSAGASMERAIYAALSDIKLLYPSGSMIEKELKAITVGLSVNKSPEDMLMDFGRRSGIREINDFATVVMTARSSGGNLIRIIRKAVANISMKIDTVREIEVLTAAKKREQKIMTVMPFIILAYLRVANPGYMDCIYHNWAGAIFMTVCLIMIAIMHYWGNKITSIEV